MSVSVYCVNRIYSLILVRLRSTKLQQLFDIVTIYRKFLRARENFWTYVVALSKIFAANNNIIWIAF